MSLATQLTALATRVATEVKSVRTLLNGNVAGLTALTTTNKSNLVAAINEVAAASGGGGSPTLANIPAGSVISVTKLGGVWPNRPTSRTDITVMFIGADPTPAIVTSPTLTGMYSGDLRVITL